MNKIDKIFKWVSVALLLLILIPIVGFTIIFFFAEQYDFLIFIVFTIAFLSTMLIPIGDLILIVLFFIRLFSKNKTIKDDEQIMLNFFSIIIYTFISLVCLAFLFLIFVSDKINT